MKTIKQAFWDKTNVRGRDECWEWMGSCTPHGYGHMRNKGHTLYAHRVSYELHNGPIPNGMVVMHSCDNPRCVNPRHLSIGTYADNSQDRENKGRGNRNPPRGESHYLAKLTSSVVKNIRNEYNSTRISQRALSKKYLVSYQLISEIVNNTIWIDDSYVRTRPMYHGHTNN